MAEVNELMTIKEFAEASGRSQQTIYKQIATRLSAYLHEIDGQKYIEGRALYEVFGIGKAQPNQPKQHSTQDNQNQPLYEILKATIDTLQHQLEAKDKQLAEKDDQLRARDREISNLTEANKELAQSINADRRNELAGTLQQLLPDAAPEGSCEPVETFQDEEVQEPAQEPPKAQESAQKAAEDAEHLRQQSLAAKDEKIQAWERYYEEKKAYDAMGKWKRWRLGVKEPVPPIEQED